MVLEEYKKKGKFYHINPLESQLGNKLEKVSSLDEIYPEIFWIYFIYKKLGLKKVLEILNELTKNKIFSGFISELIPLTKEKLEEIKKELSQENLNILKQNFKEIIIFFKECPLKFIYEEKELEEIYEEKQEISNDLIDCLLELDYKYSFGYILSLGFYIQNLIFLGRIEIPKGINFELDLNDLEKNKESKKHLSKYGGKLRSLSLCLIGSQNKEQTLKWRNYFWKEGIEKTNCYELIKIYGSNIYFYGEDDPEELTPQIKEYLKNFCLIIDKKIREIIDKDIFKNYEYTYENLEKDQIIIGLLNREIFLCKKILGNLDYWEKEIITILHRVLIENHINLIWFNEKSTKENCKDFIFQGLSNEKLYIEKLKELNRKLNSNYQKGLIQKFEKNFEKKTEPLLQDIRLSNLTNIRKKAEDINQKELHWLYDSLSDTLHSNWAFLSDKYLKPCTNPLHKRHLIPKIYQNYTNLNTPFIILSLLIDILEYLKQKLNINISDEDLNFLKKELNKFQKIFLKRWSE
ncbi:MAG: hypothetical protein ISS82_02935 [Nanoarchaeota archaeon]|nr:hypothetical protein [Nanoarchaeota archaeon]